MFASAQEKVGLVLGGGAARGLAHIGVLKAIEEFHIPIDVMGGTSMGAIIGGLWASGYTASEIESIFLNGNLTEWFTDSPIKERLPIYYTINEYPTFLDLYIENGKFVIPEGTLDDKTINLELYSLFCETDNAIKGNFRNLWKPFLCTATDINRDNPQIFTKGSLDQSIRASMSLPLIFKPAKVDSMTLFDGGMFDNIPSQAVKDTFGADFIISVDVSSSKKSVERKDLNIFDITFTLVDLLTVNMGRDSLSALGEYVRPEVGDFNGYEFNKAKELIELGYQAMKAKAPEILAKIGRSEEYPSYRKNLMKGYEIFDGRIIGRLEVEADNSINRNTVLMAIEMEKGGLFSFSKLKTGFYRLYAMGIFGSIEPDVRYNKIDKSLTIRIVTKPVNYNKMSVGAFADSKAGVNIYAKYEKNNLLNYGGLFDAYGFAGNFIKGASLNLFFPSLGYTNTIAGIYTNYHIYKYFGVFDNTYGYHHNFHSTALVGNNFGSKSVFSIFFGTRYKKIEDADLLKNSLGIYYVKNTLPSLIENVSGERRSFMLGVNLPAYDFVSGDISTYSSAFSSATLSDSYIKWVGEFMKSSRLGKKLNASVSSSAGFLIQLYRRQIPNDRISIDYVSAKPTFEFQYLYDPSLSGKYYASAGFSLKYFLSDQLFVRNESELSGFANGIVNGFSPSFIGGSRLSFGLMTIFGTFEIGGGYFRYASSDTSKSVITYSVYLGNPIEKFDILDMY